MNLIRQFRLPKRSIPLLMRWIQLLQCNRKRFHHHGQHPNGHRRPQPQQQACCSQGGHRRQPLHRTRRQTLRLLRSSGKIIRIQPHTRHSAATVPLENCEQHLPAVFREEHARCCFFVLDNRQGRDPLGDPPPRQLSHPFFSILLSFNQNGLENMFLFYCAL